MPAASESNARDPFASRIAAALQSVRTDPVPGGDAPAPAPATATPPTSQPAATEPVEQPATAPEDPPPAAPAAETSAGPKPAEPGVVSEPVIESDDSFFDDPPPSEAPPAAARVERDAPETATPAGSGDYVVQVGDCIASIASAHGLFWETLWQHPGNADLRAARRDPHVLLPGDRVHVPGKRRKEEPGQTETRHRFKRRGEPCELLVTLLDEDEQPRAGASYRLYLEGTAHSGVLDANGTLTVRMPARTRAARLVVDGDPFEEVYNLQLGALDPDDAPSGIHARLRNLGYLPGENGGVAGPDLARFQSRHGLAATGELDEATRQRLRDEHYSVGG